MDDFRKVLEDCGIKDIGYKGPWYTWARGNLSKTSICEQLDRAVANSKWFDMFPEAKLRH